MFVYIATRCYVLPLVVNFIKIMGDFARYMRLFLEHV